MLEEFVGSVWHRFITKKAGKNYPDAIVYLSDMQFKMGIFFRALGGEGGLSVVGATDSELFSRRTVLQRIAGSGKQIQYAWRDDEVLRLPESIALFADKQLNNDLYLWLTAISVVEVEASNWIKCNQLRTLKTLETWPGLAPLYQSLLQAHLQQRPDPKTLLAREALQELAISTALSSPLQDVTLSYAKRPPQPVPLWLHPSPPDDAESNSAVNADQDSDDPKSADSSKKNQKSLKRKQGNRTELPEGSDGLMSFRLESLWSWGEYSKVDRTSTDDDDDDAMLTAEDMDTITVAQGGETTAGKIKLDLDLPPSQYDDIILGEGIPVDEWDFKKQSLQKDHCRLILMESKDAEDCSLPVRLQSQARRVRRQFEVLNPQRHWLGRQPDGAEIDLESYVNFLSDRQHGRVNNDTPVYRRLVNQNRDLSCLLLADLSLSTDAYINDTTRVIDVVKDALYVFSEALSVTGDRFALHGFSSRNRNHVRVYKIKNFSDPYDDKVRGHIEASRPGYYTRMGAAIRYASQLLEKEASSQKLLLILTDGKPNDLDKYEGRYGIEDTRQAILEAERMGLEPFCITIDEMAKDYLPYLFGKNRYVLVKNASELPVKLTQLYLRLVR